MKAMILVAGLLIPALVSAEDPKPAAAPANATLIYELRDLKPVGFTQYVGAGDAIRQYFDFQNAQGVHHIIYEEVASAAPSRTVQGLRQAAVAYDSQCSMDVECTSKAFCTGDCRHMYYETANAPGDTLAPDRNKCRLLYFTCEKGAAAPAAPQAPAAPAAPAATPGA